MKARKIILFVFVIILGGLIIFFNTYLNRVRFNNSYVNGNISGNLYNAGLYCENNGSIFFANPQDKNCLYSMNSTGGNFKKICDDTAMYINADSNYVYYVRDNNKNANDSTFFSYNKNSLCRISRNGGKITILDGEPCLYASLIGDYIYYLHYDTKTNTTLYKIRIDGKKKQKVSDSFFFNCNAIGQYFYYNDLKKGNLCKYDTATDASTTILNCHCYKPLVVNENNVYYIDPDNNNSIVHTNINSNNPKVLTEGNVELFNVYGSYVYYQRGGKNPALCMIKNDGSGFKEIAKGNYTTINVTSYFIFFSNYETGEMLKTTTANPGDFNTFMPDIEK